MGVSLDDQARARENAGKQRNKDFSLPVQGVLMKPLNVAEVRVESHVCERMGVGS
jgi:hypothetical protein